MRAIRYVLPSALILITPLCASAQDTRFQIVTKGGVTIERAEDNLRGTVAAGGVTASMPLKGKWRGELELWIPAFIEDANGEPRHRDVLIGASAVRAFGDGRIRPFLLAGLTVARTEDRFPGERHQSTGMFLTGGAGLEAALSHRVSLVADIRVSGVPTSVLVRPAAGIALGF